VHQARELAFDRVSLQAGDRHDHACGRGRALEVPTGQTLSGVPLIRWALSGIPLIRIGSSYSKETNRSAYAITHARARTERDRGGWARALARVSSWRPRCALLRSMAAPAMRRPRRVVRVPLLAHAWAGLDGWRMQINIDSVLEQLERPRISVLPPPPTNKQTSKRPLFAACLVHPLPATRTCDAFDCAALPPSCASSNSSS